MKKIWSFIICFFVYSALFAQNNEADSLIRLLASAKADTGKVRRMIQLGRLLDYSMAKNDSALMYLQEAVDLSKKIDDSPLEAEATFYLATNLVNSADYPRALVLSLQNIKRLEQLKAEKKPAITLSGNRSLLFYQTRLLVFIYSNIGDYKKQLEYVKKMQEIFYANLAQQPDVSVNYYFTIYFNLANVYDKLNMPDSTLHYSSVLYKEVLIKGDAQWVALASNQLASFHEEHGNNDTAMLLSRKSIPPAVESNRLDIVTSSELRIGKLFQKKGRMDSAFYYSLKALSGVLKLNNPKDLLHAYEQVSELYKENAQFDSAYKYLQHFTVLKDSLQDLSKIAEARNFAFNQTLTDQQLAQAKKEAAQQLQNSIKLYALGGVMAFILMAAFLLMRNLRNKRKANILLTQQKEAIQNNLATLKATQSQLIQSEKMASLGELTAGIAHEIQNPLNFVNNFSEVSNELIDEMNEELNKGDITEAKVIASDIKQNLEKINHHGKRADAIVKGMLQHSQSSSGKKEATDINKLADEYLRLAYHGIRAKDNSFNATLKTDFDESIGNINIVPQDIGRVLLNLITNAFYIVNEKKKSGIINYEPTVSVSTKKINDKIEIKVADNGNGIPQKVLDKIFQPFFTTKPTGQGTGLGLSLSYDIVKAHGGIINVNTAVDCGATFTIELPFN